MKTRDLIDRLASRNSALSEHSLRNGLLSAFAFGLAASVALMVAIYGRPAVPPDVAASPAWWLTLISCIAIMGTGAITLLRAARPGPFPILQALVPLGAWLVLLLIGLATISVFEPAPPMTSPMTGDRIRCLLCIPLFSLPTASILFVALRSAAPAAPWHTGALVGLVAGASGALAFSCCAAVGFSVVMTLWFGVAIALCAAIGALCGRVFLRW